MDNYLPHPLCGKCGGTDFVATLDFYSLEADAPVAWDPSQRRWVREDRLAVDGTGGSRLIDVDVHCEHCRGYADYLDEEATMDAMRLAEEAAIKELELEAEEAFDRAAGAIEQTARHLAVTPPPVGPKQVAVTDGGRRCETCGSKLATVRSDARFCSSACRQKAWRKRNEP